MIKILCFILAALFAVGSVFGLPRGTKYDPARYEDGLPSHIIEGKVRVELLSDTLVRIETEGPKGFENRPSFTVQKRAGWDGVPFTASESDGFRVISTGAYTVYLPLSAESAEDCYITDADGAELWRFAGGTDTKLYLPSPSDALKSWYFCDNPRVIPSAAGYAPNAKNAYNGWDLDNQSQDVFVFLPGGDYKRFIADFVELTGRSEMLPLTMLGFWDSRYYEYTEGSALRQIDDYRERGYPLDMLVIDTDWRNAGSGTGYTVNKKDFPNMKRFIDKAHEKGVSLIFNDHPEPTWGTKTLLDYPEVLYRNYNLKSVLKQGLDWWWYDRNWWTTVKPVTEGLSTYATGMYAYYEITKDYYESVAGEGEYARRPAIMANVDGIGNGNLEYASELAAHRYSLQWTGDVGTTAASLEKEIFNAVYGGARMGLPYVSADLGGHTSEVEPGQYARWLQYGALSPIMRVHCTKPYSRMPWLYGEELESVAHTYIDMRYRLLPLFYSLAHENYETGLPMVRRLDIDYPQYEEAFRNDEYLLGDGILVAPIADANPAAEDYSFTSGENEGLLAEYFANGDFSGEPEVVKYEPTLWHDWVFDAPEDLSVSDYFTARWTGEIHVGDEPVFFRVMSDDGFRLWVDDELVIDAWDVFDKTFTTERLPANSTHTIRAEYFDGNNHAHIYFDVLTDGAVSREVFLPDGEWIDVWSGETYTGPATVTVSHGLDTSPVFVKKGSVFALADNTESTKAGDWSHLTLDVYPDENADAKTVLYEDDCETVAYKDGEFRTTEITLKGGDGVQTLTVFPAEGSFDGERAFTTRDYTVRIHAETLPSVTLNGEALTVTAIGQDAAGKPFAVTGASPDSRVYTFAFTADVDTDSVIKIRF
ncbi:MAG: DUF5110 domain-containing protein [Clostridia bacterium]|nr:DUF5110 domain-containing protein [Clostridia bacterium]